MNTTSFPTILVWNRAFIHLVAAAISFFFKCFFISVMMATEKATNKHTNYVLLHPKRVTSSGQNAGCIAELELALGYLPDLIMALNECGLEKEISAQIEPLI